MKGDETNRTKHTRLHRLRQRGLLRRKKMTPFRDAGRPDKSRIRDMPPDPPELELNSEDLGAEMMQALLGDPFPRQDDLEIFRGRRRVRSGYRGPSREALRPRRDKGLG